MLLRSDLDGVRLHVIGRPELWLVFHGKRHRVASPAVYQSLFVETAGLLLNDEFDEIIEGAELNEGSCLIRFDGEHDVFLLTGSGKESTIYKIASQETFLDFAFDEGRVRAIPVLFRAFIDEGEPLVSAADKAARAQLV